MHCVNSRIRIKLYRHSKQKLHKKDPTVKQPIVNIILFVLVFFCIGCEESLHPYHVQLAVRGAANAEGSKANIEENLNQMKAANSEMDDILSELEVAASASEAARDRCEAKARKLGIPVKN